MIEGYFFTCWILAVVIVLISLAKFKLNSKVPLTLEDFLSMLSIIALAPFLMPALLHHMVD